MEINPIPLVQESPKSNIFIILCEFVLLKNPTPIVI